MRRIFLALAVALSLGACIYVLPTPAPTPTPVPTPVETATVNFKLSNPVAAHITIGQTQCDADDRGLATCEPVEAGDPLVTVEGLPQGYEAFVPGHYSVNAANCPAWPVCNFVLAVVPPPAPPVAALTAVSVDGRRFVVDGKSWIYRGFTDFLLYQKYLANEPLDALLQERVDVGANTVRVLGMVTSFSHFYPQEHPDYYDRLKPFADYLASKGLRLEFVVFADAQIVMPSQAEEEAHLDRVIAAFTGATNVFIEVANEPFKNLPGGAGAATHLMQRVRGKGFLIASGNYDYDASVPVGDYLTNHPERKPEWPRTSKDQFDLAELFHVPVLSDEPMGGAESDSGSRSAQPDDFAYFAAESALAGAGGTFHSDSGIRSEPLGPIQLLSARAFFSAMKWVPVDAQNAAYQRGDADGGPGINNMPIEHKDAWALRTFCKNVGAEYCVVIRPNSAWQLIPRDGWQVAERSGPNGAFIKLTR